MADEHILTLVRAAQQAPTVEDKDRILELLYEGINELLGNRLEMPLAWPPGVAFPLPIYFTSKKLGRRVEGLLFEDKSVEVEGKHWPSPSSNEMCDIVLGYRTTMWPVWKYTDPDGRAHSINTLRRRGGPFPPPKKQEKPG